MRITSGIYKGRTLKTTTGPGFRPAMGKVREALFSMLEARGVEWSETRVLDLFAGSGSLGFEALSRGARHVAFVESASYAVKVINANAEMLGVESMSYSVYKEDVVKLMARPPAARFQVVFIDPPYRLKVLGTILQSLMKNRWVSAGAVINAEVEAQQPFVPETAHPDLELLADKAYGQTRVVLWRA